MAHREMSYRETLATIRSDYEAELERHGPDVRALKYGSTRSQARRFGLLERVLELRDGPISLLDVGCGLADLHDWLVDSPVELARYVGVDVSPRMIASARERLRPGAAAELVEGDITDFSDDAFDVVFSSGIFNVVDCENWVAFVSETLDRMFAVTRRFLIFNMQSIWGRDYVKRLQDDAVLDPLFWVTYVRRRLTPYIQLHHDYMEADFTIVAVKDGPSRTAPDGTR